MSPEAANQHRHEWSAREHPQCIVCGQAHPAGLHLQPVVRTDGSLEAVFRCEARHQGYRGLLHGGIIAALLDGIMTHCLFAHQVSAVTAEMTVRYHMPVRTDRAVLARARLVRSHGRLHLLEAELSQGPALSASARAKFVTRPAGQPPSASTQDPAASP